MTKDLVIITIVFIAGLVFLDWAVKQELDRMAQTPGYQNEGM